MIRGALLFLLLSLLAGCSARATAEEELLAGASDTAYAVKEGGRTIFYVVPRFVFWEAPNALLYDVPRSILLALRGNRAKVAAAIARLEGPDVSLEEEIVLSNELRDLTGLPIHSAERWREWWKDHERVPEREWRELFVERALEDLVASGYFVRAAAIEDLKAMYGVELGYDPKAPRPAVEAAALRWREHVLAEGLPPR